MPTPEALPAAPGERQGWPWQPQPLPPVPDLSQWPRVTVVTPSFNQAAYLETAIRSVLLQGYPNLEYFILDGGSRDGSVDIIQRYAPWLAHWASGPDGGQTAAINAGFERATGEVLAWLNADDAYLPGAIARAVVALAAAPHAVLVHGECRFVDERDNEILAQPAPVEPAPSLADLLDDRASVWQPSVFFRRPAVRQAGLLREDLFYSMDFDLLLRLRRLGEFAFQAEAPAALVRVQAEAKTYGIPMAMVAERYAVSLGNGGDGITTALRALRFRWEALRRTDPLGWSARLRQELAGAEFRSLALPLRRAARPLCAEYLAAAGFEAAGQGQPKLAAASFLSAARYSPRLLWNRGVWSVFAQAMLGRRGRRPQADPLHKARPS